MTPVRIQLSRRKGFDLQAASRAINGLECVNVARPSKWGNPFTVANSGGIDAVLRYACEVVPLLPVEELRGKNVACWCGPVTSHGEYLPCHADVLLSIANDIPMEDVISEILRRAEGKKIKRGGV